MNKQITTTAWLKQLRKYRTPKKFCNEGNKNTTSKDKTPKNNSSAYCTSKRNELVGRAHTQYQLLNILHRVSKNQLW